MGVEIGRFTDDLTKALKIPTGVDHKYGTVLVCGMGGSAIVGMVLSDLMHRDSGVRVNMAANMNFPYCKKEDTLFVACSYSGDTYETIDIYNRAIEEKLDTLVVTSGGELLKLAKNNNSKIIEIPDHSIQPRSAVGWFLGILVSIVADAGCKCFKEDITAALPDIRKYCAVLEAPDSPARALVPKLVGRTPVICSVPKMAAVTYRWKTQFNENSKIIAFTGLVPEFNHNAIVGWCNDGLQKNFIPIFLVDESDEGVANTAHAALKTLHEFGIDFEQVIIPGDKCIEHAIFAILFGDYLSLFLAAELKVDPENVEPIKKLKINLKEECSKKSKP
jgi:glucose/mannose-6-phosphate isomerase